MLEELENLLRLQHYAGGEILRAGSGEHRTYPGAKRRPEHMKARQLIQNARTA